MLQLFRRQPALAPIAPHPQFNISSYRPVEFLKKTIEKIIKFVRDVIFPALTTIALSWINPSISATSILIGICFPDEVQNIIDRIKLVVSHNKGTTLFLGGLYYFLALPVFLVSCSMLWGAHVGSSAYRNARDAQP